MGIPLTVSAREKLRVRPPSGEPFSPPGRMRILFPLKTASRRISEKRWKAEEIPGIRAAIQAADVSDIPREPVPCTPGRCRIDSLPGCAKAHNLRLVGKPWGSANHGSFAPAAAVRRRESSACRDWETRNCQMSAAGESSGSTQAPTSADNQPGTKPETGLSWASRGWLESACAAGESRRLMNPHGKLAGLLSRNTGTSERSRPAAATQSSPPARSRGRHQIPRTGTRSASGFG